MHLPLKEFALLCAEDPELFRLWRELEQAAGRYLQEVTPRAFSQREPTPSDRELETRKQFQNARGELVAECTRKNKQLPNLGVEEFIQHLLQY